MSKFFRKIKFIFSIIILILIIGLLVAQLLNLKKEQKVVAETNYSSQNTISIVAWNLQIFGDKKASNVGLMNTYKSILDGYDIIIIQEIRDSDGSAFEEFCALMNDDKNIEEVYNCEISSRAGRSTSKEQYGLLYKNSVILEELVDYNPDELDRWERPPTRFDFISANKNYSFSIYTIHIKPEDVENEILELETQIAEDVEENYVNSNILIVGDLNADCAYYDEDNRNFEDWDWIIENNEDTTFGNSDCAYDRILLNEDMSREYVFSEIYVETTAEMSDHYPISLLISNYDK